MPARARANGEGSIFPYRNGFAAYVWVTKPDGKRTRKYVYGQTREIVHDKWIKLHQQAKAGPVATRVPTLGDYLTYWHREVVRPNLAPLTCATYETILRLYVIPGLGGKRLDRLQVRDVQTWINEVARTCQCCAQGKDARRPELRRRCCALGRCCADTPSARTVKDIRGVRRSALNHAATEELVTRNAAALVKLPPVRRRRGRAWTSDEARRFLESARADRDPLYAAYVLILVLGLRKGEVLGLTEDAVDLAAGELSIGWQLQRVGGQLLHRETKTQTSDATLPLPDICATALDLRHTAKKNDRDQAGISWQGSRLLFTTRYGTPVEPRNFNRSWDARCTNASGATLIDGEWPLTSVGVAGFEPTTSSSRTRLRCIAYCHRLSSCTCQLG
ncbi:tyrosine recombinase XerC [Micromonospora sp. NPDC047730]|uniref:site-specific integrase n=1 Tax=Micromonospora sp. NPDC047730 TaxID=3364253 RepID=UPI003710E134